MLAAVTLGDGDDQLFADVARKVEVDVRNPGEVAVEEASQREIRVNRVDVRKACEITDERTDGGAAATPRGQCVPRRGVPAHFLRAGSRELEHVPVEQEDPRKPELVD